MENPMKKKILIYALCLCLLLTGCGAVDVGGFFRALGQAAGVTDGGHSLREAIERSHVIPYSQMEYTRPGIISLIISINIPDVVYFIDPYICNFARE